MNECAQNLTYVFVTIHKYYFSNDAPTDGWRCDGYVNCVVTLNDKETATIYIVVGIGNGKIAVFAADKPDCIFQFEAHSDNGTS